VLGKMKKKFGRGSERGKWKCVKEIMEGERYGWKKKGG